ncbi:hypothetical protein DUNSADRAFT_14063 [Dunaliella salina]|uniref:Encoded protein n=1 Tax=Dunaliella salina TaxID=3046 RepID=A0ABQ7G851_DUNSA|nr:hypothetical protein DUNSADRAFT_14063 [Dunaliella salina]|eukprot:KAF5830780.1 hypothetical protein DUNSADRAFT_14063 [Dunaliella salina]
MPSARMREAWKSSARATSTWASIAGMDTLFTESGLQQRQLPRSLVTFQIGKRSGCAKGTGGSGK